MSKPDEINTVHEAIDQIFRMATGGERAAFAIAYTLPPDHREVHWMTNVSREDGIKLFEKTAVMMKAQQN